MTETAVPAPEITDALPMEVDALLLDMDGTLIDSAPAVLRSWNRLFGELGSSRTFTPDLHGMPAAQVLRGAFPDLDEEAIARAHARIEDMEVDDVDGVVVLPGTHRVLGELERAAEALGRPTWTIVTSCTRRLFEARWAVTGLPVPETIVTADQVTTGKPDPEPYRLGAERLGVDPSRALVIEDAVGGLRSGRDAGARTLAVTTTTAAGDLQPLAEALVTSLDDIEVSARDGHLVVDRRGR